MDAETIRREANDAILSLELDSTVSAVTQSGKNWCVQFSGDYGQFCDSFQNQFERDNSPRVVREKIKKHLLGQITQLRNKGGRRSAKKSFDEQDGPRPNAAELLQEAITQTTRAVGDVIGRTLGVTNAGIQAAGDVAEQLTARTAELVRPARAGGNLPARPPRERSRRGSSGQAQHSTTKKKAAGKVKRAAAKKTGGKKKSSRKG
jgi:hypothetical protein